MIKGLREFIFENLHFTLNEKEIAALSLVYDMHPLYIDDELKMVVFLSSNMTGVIHMSLVCSADIKNYKISMMRHLRQVDKKVKERNPRRIEIDIKADSKVSRDFVEVFGFHEESLMPQFGSRGETYARYVRLTNG